MQYLIHVSSIKIVLIFHTKALLSKLKHLLLWSSLISIYIIQQVSWLLITLHIYQKMLCLSFYLCGKHKSKSSKNNKHHCTIIYVLSGIWMSTHNKIFILECRQKRIISNKSHLKSIRLIVSTFCHILLELFFIFRIFYARFYYVINDK